MNNKSNSWSRTKESAKGVENEAGQLVDDKFEALWKNRKVEPARVAMTVGEGMDFGARKVSATVSVSCDQNEASINKAGELTFFKALELMRDGFSQMES